jgi:hypothetical protein
MPKMYKYPRASFKEKNNEDMYIINQPIYSSGFPDDPFFHFKFDNDFVDEKGAVNMIISEAGSPTAISYENDRHGNPNSSIRFQNTIADYQRLVQSGNGINLADISGGWSLSVWLKHMVNVPNYNSPVELSYTSFSNRTGIHTRWLGDEQSKMWLDTSSVNTGLTSLYIGTWAHHFFTVSSGGVLNYWINNVKIIDNFTRLLGSWSTLSLGWGGGSHPYNGNIDDLRGYTRILTDTEREALYNE